MWDLPHWSFVQTPGKSAPFLHWSVQALVHGAPCSTDLEAGQAQISLLHCSDNTQSLMSVQFLSASGTATRLNLENIAWF